MKKFLVFILLLFPVVALAAPSVRMLGAKTATTATAANDSGTNINKTTTSVKLNQTAPIRAASNIRTKTSTSSGAISDSGTRFPVITAAKVYNSATDSKVPTVSGMVITDEIVETIVQAVKDVDDPRIDAIRTRNPKNLHTAPLPYDYVYVWIEKNQ